MAAAVTLAKIWDTPYAVAYLATHAGGAGSAAVNVDAAGAGTPDLVTDTAANSEIRRLVTNNAAVGSLAYATVAAAQIAFGQAATATPTQVRGKLTLLPRAGGLAFGWVAIVTTTAVPGNLRITVTGSQDGTAVVILRRTHSTGR